MFTKSNAVRKAVVVFTLALGGLTSPAFADSVSECYDRVLLMCDDALEEASWWEKPAVGFYCTGMLAGCGFEGF